MIKAGQIFDAKIAKKLGIFGENQILIMVQLSEAIHIQILQVQPVVQPSGNGYFDKYFYKQFYKGILWKMVKNVIIRIAKF